MASASDAGANFSPDESSNLGNGLLGEMKELLKEILKEIKRNGDDVKAIAKDVGPALSNIQRLLKESKSSDVDANGDAQPNANSLKLETKSKDPQEQVVERDEAHKNPSSRSSMTAEEILEKRSGVDLPVNKPVKAIRIPPSRFNMTRKEMSEAINKFVIAAGRLDEQLEKFTTGIRHIGSSKWMIDDIADFRTCLRAFAVLFVAHLVTVRDYKEWSEQQEWYKIDYYKTHLKNILFHERFHSEEDLAVTRLSVYDVISNITASAKRLNGTLELFLDFTAKAADIKLLYSLLESVSRLVETSQYYVTSFRNPVFKPVKEQYFCNVTHYDIGSSSYSHMHLYEVLERFHSHLDVFSTSLADFNSLEKGALTTLKPYQDEAMTNITNTITVATFFSAITATTIQFSFQSNDSSLQSSVNVFWLCSLVLSVASVLESLLAYLWRQAITSPASRTSRMYSEWVIQSPIILLAVSVVMYSMGLYIFAFSSNQRLATALSTLVFASCGFLSLVIPFTQFILDKVRHINRHSAHSLVALLSIQMRQFVLFWHQLLRRTFFSIKRVKVFLANFFVFSAKPKPALNNETKDEYIDFEGIKLNIQEALESKADVLSFSPDGKYLSARAYQETIIFKLNTLGKTKLVLKEPLYDRCNGISWSPDGQYCMFIGDDTFWIWKRNTEVLVKRKVSFSLGYAIAWLANNDAFVVANYYEDRLLRFDLHKLNLDSPEEATVEGELLMNFMSLNRVLNQRDLCAVSLNAQGNAQVMLYGYKSSVGREASGIMVCNIENGTIENKIATLHIFDNILPDRSGKMYLIWADEIVQLWKFNSVCELEEIVPLKLESGKYSWDWCFGGKNDKYALGITNEYIHIWSTESGKHLKRIPNAEKDNRIAWNPAANRSFMFITWDRYEKKLNIWGAPLSQDIDRSKPSLGGSQVDSQIKLPEVTKNHSTSNNSDVEGSTINNPANDINSSSLDDPHSTLNVDGRGAEDEHIDTSTRPLTALPNEGHGSSELSTDAQTSRLDKGEAREDSMTVDASSPP